MTGGAAPFMAQEYGTAHGPMWCAVDPRSGIVVATTTQETASLAADAMNAAYRLGAQERWCETVPDGYEDAAAELMGAAEHAANGYDVLADECLAGAQRAITKLRGGRDGDAP